MRISLQLVVQDDGGAPATVTEIAQFERDGLDVGSLGLHLEEAKSLLGRLQRTMVTAQVAEAVARTSVCPTCGAQLACKGHHHLVFRSAFGQLSIDSPRLYPCRQCLGDAPSFSPVANCLPERVSPELQYLEVKFAALMSYGLTVNVSARGVAARSCAGSQLDPAPGHHARSPAGSGTGHRRPAAGGGERPLARDGVIEWKGLPRPEVAAEAAVGNKFHDGFSEPHQDHGRSVSLSKRLLADDPNNMQPRFT